jgi:tetratricopeptide (TPR) repeat protein
MRTALKSATPASVLLFLVVLGPAVAAQTKYRSAQEAWSVGVAFYNSRNFEASREPFEAALAMAPDDKFRLKVYEALLPSYRLLPEAEKFIGACEFILTKSESPPQQSLTRRQLLAFVHQRGKTDELARRYEELLKKDPNDRLALYVLSELYAELKRDPQRAAALIERLAKLDQKAGQQVNVQQTANLAQQYIKAKKFKEGAELYEQIAPLDANLAAWHWKEAAAAWLTRSPQRSLGPLLASRPGRCVSGHGRTRNRHPALREGDREDEHPRLHRRLQQILSRSQGQGGTELTPEVRRYEGRSTKKIALLCPLSFVLCPSSFVLRRFCNREPGRPPHDQTLGT